MLARLGRPSADQSETDEQNRPGAGLTNRRRPKRDNILCTTESCDNGLRMFQALVIVRLWRRVGEASFTVSCHATRRGVSFSRHPRTMDIVTGYLTRIQIPALRVCAPRVLVFTYPKASSRASLRLRAGRDCRGPSFVGDPLESPPRLRVVPRPVAELQGSPGLRHRCVCVA